MGGRNKDEMFWPALYEGSVQKIHITTDDGSVGSKGFTVDVLPQLLATGKFDRVMVCGPEIMMKAAAKIAAEYKIPCQVSLEKHMACGLGACLSCTCAGSDGKRKKSMSGRTGVLGAGGILMEKKERLAVNIAGIKMKTPVMTGVGDFWFW